MRPSKLDHHLAAHPPARWIDNSTIMKIVNKVEIMAAPERVFYWIERPDKAKQWVTNVARSEYITKTAERIGTTFREYVEEGGQGIEMMGIITEFQPNRLFAVHLESDLHTADVSFVLKGEDGRTLLTQNVELHFKNKLNEAACDSIKKSIKDQAKSEFAELKRLCEQDN
jgi:uncharacterized protein YndB with AHSA1/START domain